MSSIADALKRAQQERERLRAPQAAAMPPSPPGAQESSLASVVLRKQTPVADAGAPRGATPLADAIRSAPPETPPAVRARRKAAETIVEDYASKRHLNLPQSIVVYHDRAGPAAEQYRKIRDHLMAANPRREHQALVVTSTAPGEGKTVTVMNLALSLAEIRANRVLVVDGDLHVRRRGESLTEMLKLRGEKGVTELLGEGEEPLAPCLKATPWHNLFVLPSGAKGTSAAAAQVLQSHHLGRLLRELRASFDWVLIDAPPALHLPDAGLWGAGAEGILLAVALHHTAQEKVRTTVRRLRSMNLAVRGAVLTRA